MVTFLLIIIAIGVWLLVGNSIKTDEVFSGVGYRCHKCGATYRAEKGVSHWVCPACDRNEKERGALL